jgi:hypothetical protein
MILTKTAVEETKVPDKVSCDICEKVYSFNSDENPEEMLIAQEFFHIRHSGGFLSSFGDMCELDLDICDSCFREMLLNKISEEKLSSFIT